MNSIFLYSLFLIAFLLRCKEVKGTSLVCQIQQVSIIINNANPKPLNIHCKDANNDLGLKTTKPHEVYRFEITTNLWCTTLYFCRFSWPDTYQSISIDIYSPDKRICHLDTDCQYRIDGGDIYRFERKKRNFESPDDVYRQRYWTRIASAPRR